MKQKTFEAVIDEKGSIEIPIGVLNDMGLILGDVLEISYPCPSEPIEKCMRIESAYHDEENDDGYFCIPNDYLVQCGMEGKSLHMIGFDEEITITTSDKLCGLVPFAVMKIFESHGISKEEVAKSIAELSEVE